MPVLKKGACPVESRHLAVEATHTEDPGREDDRGGPHINQLATAISLDRYLRIKGKPISHGNLLTYARKQWSESSTPSSFVPHGCPCFKPSAFDNFWSV